MKDITEEILFKCFRGDTTDKENMEIDRWIESDDRNFAIYQNAYRIYESYLLSDLYDESGQESQASHVLRRRKVFRAIGIAVANVAAVVAIFFCTLHIVENKMEEKYSNTMLSIYVPAGRSMDYTLPDGTAIKLNSGATLQYPMQFAKGCREVSLDGEAYFDVAHNAEQPFIVRTFASDIEVQGTEFNVNADEAAGIFSTTLIEGSVKLKSRIEPGQEIMMKPNQTVSISEGRLVLENKSPKASVRWTEGVLDISGMDFNRLVKKLELAFGVQIVIERETVPEMKFTDGRLRISDGIDYALQVLQKGSDFTYRKDYRTGVIYIK